MRKRNRKKSNFKFIIFLFCITFLIIFSIYFGIYKKESKQDIITSKNIGKNLMDRRYWVLIKLWNYLDGAQ